MIEAAIRTPQDLWDLAWATMGGAAGHAAKGLATLATLGLDGGPRSRMIVIRAAEPDRATVTLYTDATSTKILELRQDPRAALHFWAAGPRLQIRLNGAAKVTTGAALRPVWDRMPPQSLGNYGVTPPPGTAITAADAYDRQPRFDQFAQITLTAQEVDIVQLSSDFHRRAAYQRSNTWRGSWCAP